MYTAARAVQRAGHRATRTRTLTTVSLSPEPWFLESRATSSFAFAHQSLSNEGLADTPAGQPRARATVARHALAPGNAPRHGVLQPAGLRARLLWLAVAFVVLTGRAVHWERGGAFAHLPTAHLRLPTRHTTHARGHVPAHGHMQTPAALTQGNGLPGDRLPRLKQLMDENKGKRCVKTWNCLELFTVPTARVASAPCAGGNPEARARCPGVQHRPRSTRVRVRSVGADCWCASGVRWV